MQTKEAIQYVLNSARSVANAYLSDLSDSDILVRPTPESHHIAWQLGHLLLSEAMMANGVQSNAGITFPVGFEERHGKESDFNATINISFSSLSEYQELRMRQRERILELISSLSQDDLSLPGPEKMGAYAPTRGAVLLAIGTHELMHVGQWAVVRRMLGKAVVI